MSFDGQAHSNNSKPLEPRSSSRLARPLLLTPRVHMRQKVSTLTSKDTSKSPSKSGGGVETILRRRRDLKVEIEAHILHKRSQSLHLNHSAQNKVLDIDEPRLQNFNTTSYNIGDQQNTSNVHIVRKVPEGINAFTKKDAEAIDFLQKFLLKCQNDYLQTCLNRDDTSNPVEDVIHLNDNNSLGSNEADCQTIFSDDSSPKHTTKSPSNNLSKSLLELLHELGNNSQTSTTHTTVSNDSFPTAVVSQQGHPITLGLYFHVTPRWNLKRKNYRKNFYDIVSVPPALLPSLGYKTRATTTTKATNSHDINFNKSTKDLDSNRPHTTSSNRSYKTTTDILPKHQIFQLSVHGLLVPTEDTKNPEFIPLPIFLQERSIVEELQKKLFFRKFQEIKYFLGWKRLIQRERFKKRSELLSKSPIHKNLERIHMILTVLGIVSDIQSEVQLFPSFSNGTVPIETFFTAQMQIIKTCQKALFSRINLVLIEFTRQYVLETEENRLKDTALSIFKHHPYAESLYTARSLVSSTSPRARASPRSLAATERAPRPATPSTTKAVSPRASFATASEPSTGVEKAEGGVSREGERSDLIDGWDGIRAIQRIREDALSELSRLLVLGQYLINSAVAGILEEFWVRLSQVIFGIGTIKARISDSNNTNHRQVKRGKALLWDIEAVYREQTFEAAEETTGESTAPVTIPHEASALVPAEGSSEHEVDPANGKSGSMEPMKVEPALVEEGGGQSEKEVVVVTESVDDSIEVSMEWLTEGLHLCVELLLVGEGEKAVNISSLAELGSTPKASAYRVRVFPASLHIYHGIDNVFGALADLLASLPHLRNFDLRLSNKVSLIPDDTSSVVVRREKSDQLEADTAAIETIDSNLWKEEGLDVSEGGIVEKTSGGENRYLSQLTSYLFMSSQDAFELATSCSNQLQEAYAQATSHNPVMREFYGIFRSIVDIVGGEICGRIEKSSITTRLVEIFQINNDDKKDITKAIHADELRLNHFRDSIQLLVKTRGSLRKFVDRKYSLGLIVSYQKIVLQLQELCIIQLEDIFEGLPKSFALRCRQIIELLHKLEKYFQNIQENLVGFTEALQRLKLFNTYRLTFDTEINNCIIIYEFLMNRKGEISAEGFPVTEDQNFDDVDTGLAEAFVSRATILWPTSTSLWKMLLQSREKLFAASTMVKQNLLRAIYAIKEDAGQQRLEIHRLISIQTLLLKDKKYFIWTENSHTLNSEISMIGFQVNVIRDKVVAINQTQTLLFEAHELLDYPSPILEENEIDLFPDFEALDKLFHRGQMKWRAVQESISISKKVLNFKLGSSLINTQWKSIESIRAVCGHLVEAGEYDNVLGNLKKYIEGLRPTLEMVQVLSSSCFRKRHLNALNEGVFKPCRLKLQYGIDTDDTQSDGDEKSEPPQSRRGSVAIVDPYAIYFPDDRECKGLLSLSTFDIRGSEQVLLGGFQSLAVTDLVNRGILNRMESLKQIAVVACMEELFEQTIGTVVESLRNAEVKLSSDWLEDKKFRDKMMFDLHRVTNCKQLCILCQHSLKTMLTIKDYAASMKIYVFDENINPLTEQLVAMNRFLFTIHDVQDLWIHVFPYLKFSPANELDRDTSRLFQSTTEAMKRIETMWQNSNRLLLSSFQKILSIDVNILQIHKTLVDISHDFHTTIQSFLETCPRLSLLPHQKLILLARLWLLERQSEQEFIMECMHTMFEGVGELLFKDKSGKLISNPKKRATLNGSTAASVSGTFLVDASCSCIGFYSVDDVERVNFLEPIPLQLPLDEFIKSFELQLRKSIAFGCDKVTEIRIVFFKSLLSGTTPEQIISSTNEIFRHRLEVISMDYDRPNLSDYLVFRSNFAEDVWLCLGHLVGVYVVARPDLQGKMDHVSIDWRRSISDLITTCTENIFVFRSILDGTNKSIQKLMKSSDSVDKKNLSKFLALVSALYIQESYHLNVLGSILDCRNLNSALETWTAKIQLRLLISTSHRSHHSPFDITIGSQSLSYGLEYPGGFIRVPNWLKIEQTVHKTLNATVAKRCALLMHSTCSDQSFEVEMVVSARDIADALGRLCVTAPIISSKGVGYRLFLSQLVYLDAVGSIDLKNINHSVWGDFLQAMTFINTAIITKDDYSVAMAMRYPFHTNPNRTAMQLLRRKSNLLELRESMDLKLNLTNGIILVGVMDDRVTAEGGPSAIESIVRSVFDVIIVEDREIYDGLESAVTCAGFRYVPILVQLCHKFIEILSSYKIPTIKLTNIRTTSELIRRSSGILRILKGTRSLTSNSTRRLSKSERQLADIDLLHMELETFVTVLWDLLSSCHVLFHENFQQNFLTIKNSLFNIISVISEHSLQIIQDSTNEDQSAPILPDNFLGDLIIGSSKASMSNEMKLPKSDQISLRLSSDILNFHFNPYFNSCCIRLWNALCDDQSKVVVISGVSASGKTCIRRTVALGMTISFNRRTAKELTVPHFTSALGYSRIADAALVIFRSTLNWWSNRMGSLGVKRPPAEVKRKNLFSALNQQSKKDDSKAMEVFAKETVIYHGSLTTEELLGRFDSKGLWTDGILLRWFRRFTSRADSEFSSIGNRNSPLLSNSHRKDILVLDGPFGSAIEQILTSSTSRPSNASPSPCVYPSANVGCHSVVFPTGESFELTQNISIIIEVTDLSHASPAFTNQTCVLNISPENSIMLESIVSTWMNIVFHRFHSNSYWKPVLAFLSGNLLMILKDFIEIDGDDNFINQTPKSKGYIASMKLTDLMSRARSFLNIIFDLFIEIHKLLQSETEDNVVLAWERESQRRVSLSQFRFNSKKGSTLMKRQSSRSFPIATDNHSDEDSESEDAGSRAIIETLFHRVKLAVVMAGVWGYGGFTRTSEERMFFELSLRKVVTKYMSEIDLPDDSSLFEVELFLRECCIKRVELSTNQKSAYPIHDAELEKRADEKDSEGRSPSRFVGGNTINQSRWQLPVEQVETEFYPKGNGYCDIRFLTGRSSALLKHLKNGIRSGMNILLSGPRDSERSSILNNLLVELGKNCFSAFASRKHVYDHLSELLAMKHSENMAAMSHKGNISSLGETNTWMGAGNVLRTYMTILKQMSVMIRMDEGEHSMSRLWRELHKLHEKESLNSRNSIESRTLFSMSTSLTTRPTASELRVWLCKGLQTEHTSSLRPPNHTYPVVFVDDLHVAAGSVQDTDDDIFESLDNKPEELIRGFLGGSYKYSNYYDKRREEFTRKLFHRLVSDSITDDSHYINTVHPHPVIHRGCFSDPSRPLSSTHADNYNIDHIGVITAIQDPGRISSDENRGGIDRLLHNFWQVGCISPSFQNLHSILVNGMQATLQFCQLQKSFPLQNEVIELAQYLIHIYRNVTNLVDDTSFSSLEQSCIPFLMPNLNRINALCHSLFMAQDFIVSHSSLVDVWIQEWKRNIYDCLPVGLLRDKIIQILKHQLEAIEVGNWKISSWQLKEFSHDLTNSYGVVWTNLDISNNKLLSRDRWPRRYGPTIPANRTVSSITPGVEKAEDPVQIQLDSSEGSDLASVMNTFGITTLLKIVRILSLRPSQNYIILAGLLGSPLAIAAQLAAKICGLETKTFIGLETFSVRDLSTPVIAPFHSYLKDCVLSCCGLVVVETGEIGNGLSEPSLHQLSEQDQQLQSINHIVKYKWKTARGILMIIEGFETLVGKDQRSLLQVIDTFDAISLFQDSEILGIYEEIMRLNENGDSVSGEVSSVNYDFESNSIGEINPSGDPNNDETTWFHSILLEDVDSDIIHKRRSSKQYSLYASKDVLVVEKPKKFLSRSVAPSIVTSNIHQLVKDFLSNRLSRNMNVAFIAEFSTSCLLKPSWDTPPSTSENTSKRHDSNDDGKMSSRGSRREPVAEPFTQKLPEKRFTMRSVDNVHNKGLSIPTEAIPTSNLFTGPILGDMIAGKFGLLWWVLEPHDATYGFPSKMLQQRNSLRQRIDAGHRSLTDKYEILYSTSLFGIRKYSPGTIAGAVDAAASATFDSSSKSEESEMKEFMMVELRQEKAKPSRFFNAMTKIGIFHALKNHFQPKDISSDGDQSLKSNDDVRISRWDSSYDFVTKKVEDVVDVLLEEAINLLPELMSVPSAADNLFLTATMYIPCTERMMEVATEVVYGMIGEGMRSLLIRREALTDSLSSLQQSSVVMNDLTYIGDTLAKNSQRVHCSLSSFRKELTVIQAQEEATTLEFVRSEEHEKLLMLNEEIMMLDHILAYDQDKQIDIFGSHHHKIKNTTQKEWQLWASLFSYNPPQEFIDLMRVVLELINFTYVKITKHVKAKPKRRRKKRKSKGTPSLTSNDHVVPMDDDAVRRAAMSILSSADFVEKMLNIDYQNLNDHQLETLYTINDKLRETEAFGRVYREEATGIEPQEKQEILYEKDRRLYHLLREFLEGLEDCITTDLEISRINDLLNCLRNSQKVIRSKEMAVLSRNETAFRVRKDLCLSKIRTLEKESLSISSREQLIRQLQEDTFKYTHMINNSLDYIRKEIDSLDIMLRSVVSDACVAATVLVRGAWLQDHHRQLLMRQLREYIYKTSKISIESPFVLGALWDHIQIRGWSDFREGSMFRDMTSINSMSLLFLAPRYAFVIDPDCIAETAIVNTIQSDPVYSLHIFHASTFSLSTLSSTHTSPTNKHRSNYRDQRARSRRFHFVQSSSSYSNGHEDSDPVTVFVIKELQTGVSQELCDFLVTGCLPEKWNNSDTSTPRSPIKRIRVIMISTMAPIIDGNGISRPLPVPCMANVSIIQWSGSCSKTVVQEPNPMDTILGKTASSDASIETNLTYCLLSKTLPDVIMKAKSTTERLCTLHNELMSVEEGCIGAILRATGDHRIEESHTKNLPVSSDSEQVEFINFSFIENEDCWEVLRSSLSVRNTIERELNQIKTDEKQSLLFLNVMSDVFTMSAEFIRTCNYVIPQSEYAPYALTVRALCESCLCPFLMKSKRVNDIMKGFPHSQIEAAAILKAVVRIQIFYRDELSRRRGTPLGTRKVPSFRLRSGISTSSLLGKKPVSPSNMTRIQSRYGSFLSRKESTLHKPTDSSGKSVYDLERLLENSLTDVLMVYLQPLRTIFLNMFLKYAVNNINTKSEWLVKLNLWMIITMKSPSPLPISEIKTLIELINTIRGTNSLLYEYRYNISSTGYVPLTKTANEKIRRRSSTSSEMRLKFDFLFGLSTTEKNRENLGMSGSHDLSGILICNSSTFWCLTGSHSFYTGTNRPQLTWQVLIERGKGKLVRIERKHMSHLTSSFRQSSRYQHMGSTLRFDSISKYQPVSLRDSFVVEWLSLVGVKSPSITKIATVTHVGQKHASVRDMRRPSFIGRQILRVNSTKNVHPKKDDEINGLLQTETTENQGVVTHVKPPPKKNKKDTKDKLWTLQQASVRARPPSTTKAGLAFGGRTFSFLSKPSADQELITVVEGINSNLEAQLDSLSSSLRDAIKSFHPIDLQKDVQEEVQRLLDLPMVTCLLRLLEKHPGLSPTFLGIRMFIETFKPNFLYWLYILDRLSYAQPSLFSTATTPTSEDLIFLLNQLQPPFPTPVEESDEQFGSLGSWTNGNIAPTVLQTMILVCILQPHSLVPLVKFYFDLVLKEYIHLGGTIIRFDDESYEDEQDSESVQSSRSSVSSVSENPENLDFIPFSTRPPAGSPSITNSFRGSAAGVASPLNSLMISPTAEKLMRHRSLTYNINDLEQITEVDDDDEDDDDWEDEDNPTLIDPMSASALRIVSRAPFTNKRYSINRLSEERRTLGNSLEVNEWLTLSKIIAQIYKPHSTKNYQNSSKYQLKLRDHSNWEEVLYSYLVDLGDTESLRSEPNKGSSPHIREKLKELTKYIPLDSLRISLDTCRNTFYLIPSVTSTKRYGSNESLSSLTGVRGASVSELVKASRISAYQSGIIPLIIPTILPNHFKEEVSSEFYGIKKRVESYLQSKLMGSKKQIIIKAIDSSAPLGNAIFDYVSNTIENRFREQVEDRHQKQGKGEEEYRREFSIIFGSQQRTWNQGGYGPSQKMIQYRVFWLSRYKISDLISSTISTSNKKPLHTSSLLSSQNITTQETLGIILTELGLIRIHVQDAIINELKLMRLQAGKAANSVADTLETTSQESINTTVVIIFIWKLCLYLNSTFREMKLKPSLWTRSLQLPTDWEVIRILLKCREILNISWEARILTIQQQTGSSRKYQRGGSLSTEEEKIENYLSHPLPKDRVFIRFVGQCCETLCPIRGQKEFDMETARDEKEDNSDKGEAKDGEIDHLSDNGLTMGSSHSTIASVYTRTTSMRMMSGANITGFLPNNRDKLTSESNTSILRKTGQSSKSEFYKTPSFYNTSSNQLTSSKSFNISKGIQLSTSASFRKSSKQNLISKSSFHNSSRGSLKFSSSFLLSKGLSVQPTSSFRNSSTRQLLPSSGSFIGFSSPNNRSINTAFLESPKSVKSSVPFFPSGLAGSTGTSPMNAKATEIRPGRISAKAHRIARANALAAEELADDEQEVEIFWGGRRVRDRFFGLSILLFSNLITNKDKESVQSAASTQNTEDVISTVEAEMNENNEVWPVFRADRCYLRIGGMDTDNIVLILMKWIANKEK